MEYRGLHPRRISRRKKTTGDVLTVSQAAEMLGVDKQTIRRKYLALDPEDDAPIPFNAWYRLPGGHIRIFRYIIIEMQNA